MRFSAAFVALVVALPIFGARVPIKTPKGPVKTDSYIVVLKAGADKEAHFDSLNKVAAGDLSAMGQVTHDYGTVLHGYAAILKGLALDHVLTSSDVEYVEADGIASVNFEIDEVRDDGVEIVEREESVVERAPSGSGVIVYGIDTGIFIGHSCFGGRASWGATYGGYANADGNGHGTHTAGTAVGSRYGVATSATIVAVKVLSDSGSGAYSDIISGVNYAYNRFRNNRAPSIATMSLGGPRSAALDTAVSNAISGGLHFTIAAGNSNTDAAQVSPADVPPANTVGAVDDNHVKASFSNYGPILDVWAPGVNILSAWIGGATATARLSGTSMATPYVAGILAVALGKYGSVSPASLSASLKSHARPIVTGQPRGTTNLFASPW